jgi:hypothetical protein
MKTFYELSVKEKRNWYLDNKTQILADEDLYTIVLKNKKLKQFWTEIFKENIQEDPDIVKLVPLNYELKEIIFWKNNDLFYNIFSLTEIKEMMKFGSGSLAISIFKEFYKKSKDYSNEEIEYILLENPYSSIIYHVNFYTNSLSCSFIEKTSNIPNTYRASAIFRALAHQIHYFNEETISKLSKNEMFSNEFYLLLDRVNNNNYYSSWQTNFINDIINKIDILYKYFSNNPKIKSELKTIEWSIFK